LIFLCGDLDCES